MPVTLSHARELFLASARAERNLSERTVADYGKHLANLVAFGERTGVRVVDELDVHVLRAWLVELTDVDHRGKHAVVQALYAARTFCRWMYKRRMTKLAAGDALGTPKLTRPLPKTLTEEQAAALMDAPEKGSDRGLRDRCILELLYGSLRVSEVCALDRADVHLDDASVTVRHGKGDKDRLVPIGRHAVSRLRAWLLRRPTADVDALFLTLETRSLSSLLGLDMRKPQRIGKRAVELMVQRYAEKVGIEGGATPHALRHTCATAMMRNGADLRAIQSLLGHSSLNTTERYLRLDVADMQRAHRAAHPLALARPRGPGLAKARLRHADVTVGPDSAP